MTQNCIVLSSHQPCTVDFRQRLARDRQKCYYVNGASARGYWAFPACLGAIRLANGFCHFPGRFMRPGYKDPGRSLWASRFQELNWIPFYESNLLESLVFSDR